MTVETLNHHSQLALFFSADNTNKELKLNISTAKKYRLFGCEVIIILVSKISFFFYMKLNSSKGKCIR